MRITRQEPIGRCSVGGAIGPESIAGCRMELVGTGSHLGLDVRQPQKKMPGRKYQEDKSASKLRREAVLDH
jgi:hypothetical protein